MRVNLWRGLSPTDAPTVPQIYHARGRMWWERYREALPCNQRVVPLSRSNEKMILSVCWKIKQMSSLSRNSWEEQHVQRIDKQWETESQRALWFPSWLSVCLENSFHGRIFTWLFHLPSLGHDKDIIVICCVFRYEIQILVTWMFTGLFRCQERNILTGAFYSSSPGKCCHLTMWFRGDFRG